MAAGLLRSGASRFGYAFLAAAFVASTMVANPGLAARSQAGPLVGDVAPDATKGNGQTKVLRDPAGLLYAIYTAPHEGADAVFVATSEDGGTTWYEEVMLSRAGVRAGLGTLAVDPAGVLHASWVDYETVGHVWYAARTTGWSVPEKISPGPDYAGFPAMVADRESPHVLWYGAKPNEEYSHGSEYEIEHTYLTPTGWSTPELVSIGSFDALNPTAATAPDDSIVAAWYQRSGELYRANVAAWNGRRWDAPTTVSPATANALGVSMDIGPDGTVHLIWQQFTEGIPGIVYAAYRDDAWTEPELLSPGPAADPGVAVESADRVVTVWSTDEGIEARRWDGSWGDPMLLGKGGFPSLLPGDPVSVLWTRPRGDAFELAFAQVVAGQGPPILLIGLLALVVMAGGLILARRRTAR